MKGQVMNNNDVLNKDGDNSVYLKLKKEI